MLLISCHIVYTFHLWILVIFFYAHACRNFRSRYGEELYVPEGTITVRDNDFYMYDLNTTPIMIQMGSMSSTQTGPQYL